MKLQANTPQNTILSEDPGWKTKSKQKKLIMFKVHRALNKAVALNNIEIIIFEE